jgi:hypothetical protein
MDAWHHIPPLELEHLCDAITHGANVCYNGVRSGFTKPENMPSATRRPRITKALLKEQVEKGILSGFYAEPPFADLKVSPLGIVDKDVNAKALSKRFRQIVDFSSPAGSSINDGTPKQDLSFDRVDGAIRMFLLAGFLSFMLVWDKASAYTSIDIRPEDYHLHGLFWPTLGFCYATRALFGARSSAYLWEPRGRLFAWLLILCPQLPSIRSFADIRRWVDDFFHAGSPCFSEAYKTGQTIMRLARRYGFSLHPQKWDGPSRVVQHVGIIFDSVKMTLSLPPGKLAEYATRLARLSKQALWSKHDLESALGMCFRVASILPAVRGWLSRLLAAKRAFRGSLSSKRRTFDPPCETRADLSALRSVFLSWSGSSPAAILACADPSFRPGTEVWVDASPNGGCGIFFPATGHWLYHELTPEQKAAATPSLAVSSTFIECLSIVYLLSSFPELLQGKAIHVITDCEPVEKNFKKGFSTGSPLLAEIFRLCASMQVALTCTLTVTAISRKQNTVADALSKGDIKTFFKLALACDLSPMSSSQPFRTPSTSILPEPRLFCY